MLFFKLKWPSRKHWRMRWKLFEWVLNAYNIKCNKQLSKLDLWPLSHWHWSQIITMQFGNSNYVPMVSIIKAAIFFQIWGTSSLSCGALIPLFWTGWVLPWASKPRWISLLALLPAWDRKRRLTSDAIPVNILMTRIATFVNILMTRIATFVNILMTRIATLPTYFFKQQRSSNTYA